MDSVLYIFDEYLFTPYVYPKWWSEDDIWRQFISMNIIVNIMGAFMYLGISSINYAFVFDKRLLEHPQVLENQVQKEVIYAMKSIPMMAFLTSIMFLLEIRGYSRLYDRVDDSKYGWWMIGFSIITFILFTDLLIYWIHRWLHIPFVYKHIHKPHHKWKMPTPYASFAFHPIDGFLQSTPYHIYAFLFPLHKYLYLALYLSVNIWTVSIHDGDFRVPDMLKPYVNGSAHHMDHHLYYNYNYGQYFTLWDRIGGSFKNPSAFEGKGPMDTIMKRQQKGDAKKDK